MKRAMILIGTMWLAAGCGGDDEETGTATPAAASPAEEGPATTGGASDFVGHWRYVGMDGVVMTISSNGRVRLQGMGEPCMGSYTVEDGEYEMTYDEGQPHCSDMGVAGTLREGGQQLRFGLAATYERVDAQDEAL